METFRISLRASPSSPAPSPPDVARSHRAAILAVARALNVTPTVAGDLLTRPPLTLPVRLASDDANALASKLRAGNVACDVEPVPGGPPIVCAAHAHLDADRVCERCEERVCIVCVATGSCVRCASRVARTRTFFRVRVSVLLAILAGTLVYAWHDVKSRRARNDWTRTLDVALVVTERSLVDPAAIALLRTRASALEARMLEEWTRRTGGARAPFAIHVLGPVVTAPPPAPPDGDTWLDAARASWALRKWTSDVDALANVDASRFDVRLYVVARRPPRNASRTFVEGRGEEGGRVGLVNVELDDTMVDLTLIVSAHELFHTLGATDKYDTAGRARIPDGLAEPDLGDHQRFTEVMARNRPIGGGQEAVPDTLDEIAVGNATAREIGW